MPDAEGFATSLEMLADFECPQDCDFLDGLSEVEASDVLGGDDRGNVRCPICGEELEPTLEAALDMLDFVAERMREQ